MSPRFSAVCDIISVGDPLTSSAPPTRTTNPPQPHPNPNQVLISYVPPLNVVFSTGPLAGLHWLCGIPWFLLCFLYDETRKAAMRRSPGGWVERLTYW